MTQFADHTDADALAAELYSAYSRPFVPRDQKALDAAVGAGAINVRTMANLDSLGKGPEGRVYFGRKVLYPSAEFFKWFCRRLSPVSRDTTLKAWHAKPAE